MMFVRAGVLALLIAVPFFLSAGRLDVPRGWIYVAAVWSSIGTVMTVVGRVRPDLLRERMRPPSDRDRASRRIALPLLLAHWAIAGLDVRFGWSSVPLPVSLAGVALVVAALALTGWVQVTNPYASSAVRIQSERGHEVISTGPYGWVRHPMYLGVFLATLGSGAALGSWWAALALLPMLAVFVRRTLLEDRMLHAELAGYAEYATRVRWRVVPGFF